MEHLNELKEISKKKINEEKHIVKAFEKSGMNEVGIRKISTINEHLEGQKYPGTDIEYKRKIIMVNGERIEGVFPEFNSKFNVMLPRDMRTASDTEQFKCCTNRLKIVIDGSPELAKQFTSRQLEQIRAGEPRISGLTWHHNESPGKMQLIDGREHNLCRHNGGRSIWGGGQSCR